MRKNYFIDLSFLLNTTGKKKTNLTNKIDFKKNPWFFVFFLTLTVFFPNSNYGQSDTCAGATALTVNASPTCTVTTSGTTVGATESLVACTGNADDDVWYKFVATNATHTITVTPTGAGAIANVVFQVFSGVCTGLTDLGCVNNTTGASAETTTLSGLTPTVTYLVRVYSNGNGTKVGTFTICVSSPSPCVAPTQATAYTAGAITSTTIPASFTGSANNYLIIQSASATAPTHPVNGTTYTAGNINTLGAGLTFVQNGAATSFTATGLTGNTKYYYYIYAYNNTGCSGGPTYAAGVLSDNSNTCPAVPNSVTTASVVNTSYTLNWTAPTGGSAAAITYTVEVTTNAGYTIPIAGSPFTVSAPTTTLNITGLTAGTIYYYRVRANNGCSSAWVNGNVTTTAPGLTNNDPCGAISLTVNTTCSFTTYTNAGATATTGVTAPGCASYMDDDVWFKAIVPLNGILNIDTQAGVITDSGMAVYSGAVCGALTLIECDDDDSADGLMSSIALTGRIPGETIYIRMWEYGGDVNGTFGICVSSPTPVLCANNPSNLVVTPLSQTTATVTWTAAVGPPTNGYQYYLSTSSATPGATPVPLVNVPTGTTVNLTGLLSGSTYYIWIRSNCGGVLGQGVWIGPVTFVMPNCSLGSPLSWLAYEC